MRRSQAPVLVLTPRRLVLPGVLLAGIAVLLLSQKNTPAARLAPIPTETPSELRLLLPDTFVVVHANVAALMKSELTRPLIGLVRGSGLGKPEDVGLEAFGVRLTDIQTFSVLTGERHNLIIVTSHKPIVRDDVVKALTPRATAHTIKDRTIHVAGDQKFPRKDGRAAMPFEPYAPAVTFLSDRTWVSGMARDLVRFAETAVKVDEKHPLASVLGKAGGHHLTVALSLPEKVRAEMRRDIQRSLWDELDDNPISGLTLASLRPLFNAKSGSLTVDIGADSRADVTVQFDDFRSAARGRDAARFALHLFKGGVSYLEEELAGAEAPEKGSSSKAHAFFDSLREALDNGIVKAEDSTIKAAVKVRVEPEAVKAAWTEVTARLQTTTQISVAQGHLKQLAVALHNYASNYQDRLPPAVLTSADGKPLFSWRVALLPYIEEDVLYKQLKLDEAWDSAHNKKVLSKAKMPRVFELPGVAAKEGHTYFRIFTGAGTLYPDGKQARYTIANMPDGTSSTVALVEVAEAVHWAAPDTSLTLAPRVSALKQLGNHYGKGTLLARWDGSVMTLSRKVTETTLRNAIGPDDGLVLGADWSEDEDYRRGRDKGRKYTAPARTSAKTKTETPLPAPRRP